MMTPTDQTVKSAAQSDARGTANPEQALRDEAEWGSMCAEQGWNEASQVTILEAFVREKGLMGALLDHAIGVANDENADVQGSDLDR